MADAHLCMDFCAKNLIDFLVHQNLCGQKPVQSNGGGDIDIDDRIYILSSLTLFPNIYLQTKR